VPQAAAPSPPRCLLLFTKPARPGRVKTRLAGATPGGLTAEQAARLHAAFLGDLAERLLPATLAGTRGAGTPVAAEMRLRVAWALDGEEESAPPLPDLAAEVARAGGDVPRLSLPDGAVVDAVQQRGGDLGERLYRALHEAAAHHPGGVAAVGSDHPRMPLACVRQAFAALADHHVVLGPSDDGGYYLIALRAGAVRRELFAGVAWSTDTVLAETAARCRSLGLSLALLPAGRDVDEPADLVRLAADLATAPGEPACPRSRALLAAWGLLVDLGAPASVEGGSVVPEAAP
jgi:rSAM/selenodomain-associated transferase 1